MNHKRTMSDEDARNLIQFIKRRTRGIPGNTYMDYFHRPAVVCELVEATLLGLGYDADWVLGPFDQMLNKAVEEHQKIVYAR